MPITELELKPGAVIQVFNMSDRTQLVELSHLLPRVCFPRKLESWSQASNLGTLMWVADILTLRLTTLLVLL